MSKPKNWYKTYQRAQARHPGFIIADLTNALRVATDVLRNQNLDGAIVGGFKILTDALAEGEDYVKRNA